VWSLLIVIYAPRFNDLFGVIKRRKPILLQALHSRRPLKLSMKALSVGLPGRLKSSFTILDDPTTDEVEDEE
jgi:hypothetical protein